MARLQWMSPEIYPGFQPFLVHLDTPAERLLVEGVVSELCGQGRPINSNAVALDLIRARRIKVRVRARGRHVRDQRLWALSQYWNAETPAQERDASRQLAALGVEVS